MGFWKWLFGRQRPKYLCVNCGTEFHEDDTCPCGTEAIVRLNDGEDMTIDIS